MQKCPRATNCSCCTPPSIAGSRTRGCEARKPGPVATGATAVLYLQQNAPQCQRTPRPQASLATRTASPERSVDARPVSVHSHYPHGVAAQTIRPQWTTQVLIQRSKRRKKCGVGVADTHTRRINRTEWAHGGGGGGLGCA